MDAFQHFRNKAKDRVEREKLLEQQEQKQRSHKEAAEKHKQEQQKKREEMERYVSNDLLFLIRRLGEYFRKISIHRIFRRTIQPLEQILGRAEDIKSSPQGSSGSPSPNDRGAAKRAEQRKLEQERRRREAVGFLWAFFCLWISDFSRVYSSWLLIVREF